LLKDVGVPHAILINLARNCTKQQIIFGAGTKKKALGGDAKLQKLLSALRWLIYNCGKLFSIEEACRLPIFICKSHAKSPTNLHANSTHCMQRRSSFATHLGEQK
jgi:hypothetical protein